MKTAIARSGIPLFPHSLLSSLPLPSRHSRSRPSVIPALASLSFLLSPLCHSRRFLAGIQCLSLLSFHSCGPPLGTARGFPIENVGNDRGGLKMSGMAKT